MTHRLEGTLRSGLALLSAMAIMACGPVVRPTAVDNRAATFDVKAHTPMPISCAACHESSRPGDNEAAPLSQSSVLPVRDVFFHALEFGGDRDCVNCHNRPENAGITFQGAHFNHQTYPDLQAVKSCQFCHEGHRPQADRIIYSEEKGKIENAYFHDQAFAGRHDCSECHNDPKALGKTFSGAKFPHLNDLGQAITTRVQCHKDQRPEATSGVPDDEPNKFLHDQKYRGDQDCALCHNKNIGKDWGGNAFTHLEANGTMVTDCNACHHDRQIKDHDNSEDRGPVCTKCHSLSAQPTPGQPPVMTWKRPPRPPKPPPTGGSSSSVSSSSSSSSSSNSVVGAPSLTPAP